MPIRLVILDSIAAPTRRDFGGGSAEVADGGSLVPTPVPEADEEL